MPTFAKRLKRAIEKRNLSQAEAARRCGISQQSMNYIINNDLASSKLATQIAACLGVNPEWLIYARGRFEETKIYELPILDNFYMLKNFLNHQLGEDNLNYTYTDINLGEQAFAYLWEVKKLALCYHVTTNITSAEYLTIHNSTIIISKNKEDLSFPIVEWRIRHVEF